MSDPTRLTGIGLGLGFVAAILLAFLPPPHSPIDEDALYGLGRQHGIDRGRRRRHPGGRSDYTPDD